MESTMKTTEERYQESLLNGYFSVPMGMDRETRDELYKKWKKDSKAARLARDKALVKATPLAVGDVFVYGYNFIQINRMAKETVWYDELRPEEFDVVDYKKREIGHCDRTWNISMERLYHDDKRFIKGRDNTLVYVSQKKTDKYSKMKKTELIKLPRYNGGNYQCVLKYDYYD